MADMLADLGATQVKGMSVAQLGGEAPEDVLGVEAPIKEDTYFYDNPRNGVDFLGMVESTDDLLAGRVPNSLMVLPEKKATMPDVDPRKISQGAKQTRIKYFVAKFRSATSTPRHGIQGRRCPSELTAAHTAITRVARHLLLCDNRYVLDMTQCHMAIVTKSTSFLAEFQHMFEGPSEARGWIRGQLRPDMTLSEVDVDSEANRGF